MLIDIGEKFSHYEILEKLGEGGMGVVYKARDTSLNRFVALKFLPAHLTEDESVRKRFMVEAQAASALDHANICTIHEINETPDGQLYICMGYYQGKSLKDKIKDERLKIEESIDIVIQVAKGLQAAHAKGIIHRDIKPGNILITDNGEVKIVDFGLAKLAGIELTRSTSSKGTAAYMCPEQILGQDVDHRCDIWALGIVLFELLTGQLPFEGDCPEPILYAIVNKEPKPLAHFPDDFPPGLQPFIDRILAKNPDKRYQTIAEMLDDLDAVKSEKEPKRFRKLSASIPKRKSKKFYITLIAVLTALMVITWLGISYRHSDQAERIKIAVLPVQSISQEADQEWFTEGLTDGLISSLAQNRNLRVTSRTSSMKYKESDKSPPQIGAELDVAYLVECLLMETGNQTKLSVKIIDAFEDEYIWAREFQSTPEEIPRLFSRITQEIEQEMGAEPTVEELARTAGLKPVNPEAYELYLRGKYHLQRYETQTAVDFFEKAIALDSSFVEAYTGLIYAYDYLNFVRVLPREEGLAKEKELIEKAFALDSASADVYAGLATYLLWQEWNFEGAGKAFERAFTLNPNLTGRGAGEYVWYLSMMGDADKAIAQAEKNIVQDPLDYTSRRAIVRAYLFAERYQEALKHCLRLVELNIGDIYTDWMPADIYDLMGKYDQAHTYRLALLREGKFRPDFKRPGKTDEEIIASYDSLFKEIGSRAYIKWRWEGIDMDILNKYPPTLAEHYMGIGENEQALDDLEKMYVDRNGQFLNTINNPQWKPVRNHPRYQALMRKLKLPD